MFSFSTLWLFIPHSQLHLLHRHNQEGEEVTQHLSHARQTSTKTPSGEAMRRPTKLRGFHSVSVADRFSRWFRDGVSSVRRRRREASHTNPKRGKKKNHRTAAVCVSQVCRSTAVAGLLAQAGRTSRMGCGTRTAATWQSSRSSPDGWLISRRLLLSGFLRRGEKNLTSVRQPLAVNAAFYCSVVPE